MNTIYKTQDLAFDAAIYSLSAQTELTHDQVNNMRRNTPRANLVGSVQCECGQTETVHLSIIYADKLYESIQGICECCGEE